MNLIARSLRYLTGGRSALGGHHASAEGLQRAARLLAAGKVDRAKAVCLDLVRQDSTHPEALGMLGSILGRQGQYADAEQYLRRALTYDAESPSIWNDLGNVLQLMGCADEAIHVYRRAIELDERYISAGVSLGVLLSQRGQFHEGAQVLEHVLDADPNNAKALFFLGVAYESLNRRQEAESLYRRILVGNCGDADAQFRLVSVLEQQGRHEEAKTICKQLPEAAQSNPTVLLIYARLLVRTQEFDAARPYVERVWRETGDINARALRGAIHQESDDLDLAESDYLAVLNANPRHADVLSNYAMLCQYQGRHQEAVDYAKRAVEVNPTLCSAYYILAMAGKTPVTDPLVNQMIGLLDSPGLGQGDRSTLGFALGKIFDDAQQYDDAFRYYAIGNSAKEAHYDANAHRSFVRRLMHVFHPERLAQENFQGLQKYSPIFVVGTPRSGTTLTEQIISSHSLVEGLGELTYISEIGRELALRTKEGGSVDREALALAAKKYQAQVECLLESTETRYFTDKAPGNYHFLGLIAALFPEAKIIHCTRNPLDACLSMYFQNFRVENEYSFDLENLASHYRDYLGMMKFWHEQLPGRILDVAYEDMVADRERVTRDVLSFVGLEWDDACERYYENKRTVSTASHWQVRQKLYRSSAGRWKNYERHIGVLRELLE